MSYRIRRHGSILSQSLNGYQPEITAALTLAGVFYKMKQESPFVKIKVPQGTEVE